VGGVSGHAGLFSTAEDVSVMGQFFLDLFNNQKRNILTGKTLKFFVKRATPRALGDWGLGFTIPTRPLSTAGKAVSDLAFGHVGFTGTSLWIDPKRDAVVTILSNRTYPDRNDERFKVLRRKLHDQIWEMIDNAR
jgi:CubicO group peptidase (beta-lactamase class C family)